MKFQVRVAFRPDELDECEGVAGLSDQLEKHKTSPFWLDAERSTLEVIRDRVPRVLRRVHAADLVLGASERKLIRFFELRAKRLIRVSDEDFDAWDKGRWEFQMRASPDGCNVRVPVRLPLSGAELGKCEIGCPEAGEHCFVTNRETVNRLKELGVQGLGCGDVVSATTNDVVTMQATTILSSSTHSLAFGCALHEDGCRILDRPAVMAINDIDATDELDVGLLPESRDSCAGTLVVGLRFVKACKDLGVSGVSFSPVLVIGDELWRRASAHWEDAGFPVVARSVN